MDAPHVVPAQAGTHIRSDTNSFANVSGYGFPPARE